MSHRRFLIDGQVYFISQDCLDLASMALEDFKDDGFAGRVKAIRLLRDSFGMTLVQAHRSVAAVEQLRTSKEG